MEPEPTSEVAADPSGSAPDEAPAPPPPVNPEEERRNKVLAEYRKVLLSHKETESKVKQSARAPLPARPRARRRAPPGSRRPLLTPAPATPPPPQCARRPRSSKSRTTGRRTI